MAQTNPPKLSVVIPTLNRESYLVSTIQLVLADRFKDLELLVVDQSHQHEPKTQAFLEGLHDARFRYFQIRPNSGVAAKNLALAKARADIVLFLDDDIELSSDCITAHYQTLADHPEVGGVAGRVEQPWLETEAVLHYFDRYAIPHGRFNWDKAGPATNMPGGNMSVRRTEALRVGGFDTNFLRSQQREESEFSERYRRAGNELWFEPKASVKHLEAPSGGTRIQTDFADNLDYYKNNLYFTLRFCKPWVLPLALAKQYRKYALRKNLAVTLRRTPLFIWGLITAIRRMAIPHRTVSRIVRELP